MYELFVILASGWITMSEETKMPDQSLPEEIRELERLLEEKKRVLTERGEEHEHKKVFREVFREKYGEMFQPSPPSQALTAAKPLAKKPIEEEALRVDEREEALRTLLELSFREGVRSAVEKARRLTPWLLDELHDRLIDEYYQKLIQARQIRE